MPTSSTGLFLNLCECLYPEMSFLHLKFQPRNNCGRVVFVCLFNEPQHFGFKTLIANAKIKVNRPFVKNDQMVQNPPCWRASSLLFPRWDIKTKASQV